MRGRFVEVYEYRIFLDSEGGIVQYDGEPIYINVDKIVSVEPMYSYDKIVEPDYGDEVEICRTMGVVRLESGERYLTLDYRKVIGDVQ